MSKKTIITGAAGNLGQAVVKKFVEEDYQIEATAVNEQEKDAINDIENLNATMVDLMDEEAAAKYINKAVDRLGGIDAAILLVGGFGMGDIASTTKADLEKMYKLNFQTAFFTAKPVLEKMKQHGGGRIVLMGAKPALKADAAKGVVAYSLSKSLIFRLAEIINEEGKDHNIVATVVAPSIIDTPPNREAMPDASFDDWVTPQSIAENIAFIVSDKAKDQREPIIKMYGNS
jgi:NAD(P)-dependent dehydrogenase (short-subunit alcohol dehydrogenase family)